MKEMKTLNLTVEETDVLLGLVRDGILFRQLQAVKNGGNMGPLSKLEQFVTNYVNAVRGHTVALSSRLMERLGMIEISPRGTEY